MSRSNNIEIKNPATKFIEWSGEKATLHFYDKEKKEKVNVPIPFAFLVLDTLATVKGYCKEEKSGFWSNEVRNTKTDILSVRTKSGEIKKGLYREVIDSKELRGARFCQSVYIAIKNDTGMALANLQLVGSGLNAWIDFRKKNDVFKGAVQITGGLEAVNGSTTYFSPIFKAIPVTEASDKEAKALDVILQEYLVKYFNKTKSDQQVQSPADTHTSRGTLVEDSTPEDVPETPEGYSEIPDEAIPF